MAITLALINTAVLVLAFVFGNNLWESFREKPRISLELMRSQHSNAEGERVNGFCLQLENEILKPITGVRAKATVIQESRSTVLRFPEHGGEIEATLDFRSREVKPCVQVTNPFFNDREAPEEWYLSVRLIGENFEKRVLYYCGPEDLFPRRLGLWDRSHRKRADDWGSNTHVGLYEREVEA